MSNLRKIIAQKGIKKEHIINTTKIHRNKFYIGLDAPNVFNSDELKAIAEVLGVKVKQLSEI